MRLDELKWQSVSVCPTRYAVFGDHSIWEFNDGSQEFSVRENWRTYTHTEGRHWDGLDAVAAQAIVYELLKEQP